MNRNIGRRIPNIAKQQPVTASGVAAIAGSQIYTSKFKEKYHQINSSGSNNLFNGMGSGNIKVGH